jgi:hypothetical protein
MRHDARTPVATVHGPAPELPHLKEEAPLFVSLEREVEEQFHQSMRDALQERVDAVAASQEELRPICCGKPMGHHDSRRLSWTARVGRISALVIRWRCGQCRAEQRPLLGLLGVEPGRISGSLARLLAVLGVVVPYELAARLAKTLLGVDVSAMTVWRAVQRLGATVDEHCSKVAAYHADNRSDVAAPSAPPDAVVIAVDGCALGMRTRERRRRRSASGEALQPLPETENGGFREVKTGVLLLPDERIQPCPGRRSVLRRVLVTCLGDADAIFDRIWAQLQGLGWLGKKTVAVIVGDGAQWIWNRAALYPRRCEILDFWHAIEYAWEFARLRYGKESKLALRWVNKVAKDLRAGHVEKVITRLKRLSVPPGEIQDKLTDLIRYYTNNACRMRYDEYLRLGYGIGSGAVESAHKQVIHARLRQAGMRWSEVGAHRLLALRLLLLNNSWETVDLVRMHTIAA